MVGEEKWQLEGLDWWGKGPLVCHELGELALIFPPSLGILCPKEEKGSAMVLGNVCEKGFRELSKALQEQHDEEGPARTGPIWAHNFKRPGPFECNLKIKAFNFQLSRLLSSRALPKLENLSCKEILFIFYMQPKRAVGGM